MGAFAIGGAYAVSAGMLIWAVETDIIEPMPWVPGWIVFGGLLALIAVFRQVPSKD